MKKSLECWSKTKNPEVMREEKGENGVEGAVTRPGGPWGHLILLYGILKEVLNQEGFDLFMFLKDVSHKWLILFDLICEKLYLIIVLTCVFLI